MLNLLKNQVLILINKQHVLSFILSIKIRLLRTGNVLFRVIKPLLFLVNTEALYGYSEIVVRPIIKPVSKINKKAFLSLYSRAVLAG
jgi:hypothetical protein